MTETKESIQEEIKTQGEVVRKLKAAKETKEKASIQNLMKFLDVFTKADLLMTFQLVHACIKKIIGYI